MTAHRREGDNLFVGDGFHHPIPDIQADGQNTAVWNSLFVSHLSPLCLCIIHSNGCPGQTRQMPLLALLWCAHKEGHGKICLTLRCLHSAVVRRLSWAAIPLRHRYLGWW